MGWTRGRAGDGACVWLWAVVVSAALVCGACGGEEKQEKKESGASEPTTGANPGSDDEKAAENTGAAAQEERATPAADPPATGDDTVAQPDPTASGQAPDPQTPSELAVDWSGPLPPATMDPELVAGLEAMVANCAEIRADGCVVYQCGEHMDAFDALVEKKGRIASLETLSGALFSDDDRMVTVAAHRLGSSLFSVLDGTSSQASAVDANVVRRLLEAASKLEKCRATGTMKPAIHAAMLAGIRTPLYEVIDGHAAPYMKTVAYPELMRFGRGDAFPKVVSLVEAEGGDEQARAAAMSALRNVPQPTDSELAEWCPFAARHVSDASLEVAAQAGQFMVRCRGTWIDALLDEGERRLEAGTFRQPFSQVFREICFGGPLGNERPGSPEQCERNYAFLEKVTNTDSVESQVRGQALWNIYYQRRDQTSLDLMVRYLEHPVREVRTQALDAARSLVDSYKLSAELPVDPKTKMTLAAAECAVTGAAPGAGGIAALAVDAAGRLLVVDQENALRRYAVSLDTGCSLTHDTTFGTDGVLQLEGIVSSLAFGAEGGFVASGGAVHVVDASGKISNTCKAASAVALAQDGTVWGFAASSGSLGRLVFAEDGSCSLEPVTHPFERVDAIALAANGTVLAGGTVREPIDGARHQVIAFAPEDFAERARMGTRYSTEDGFGAIHGVTACPPGICVLDGNFKALTLWSADAGRFLTRLEFWRDFKDLGRPSTPAIAFVGETGLLAANDAGAGKVWRIDGVTLPEAAPASDAARATKFEGLGAECTAYARAVEEFCETAPADIGATCEMWLDGFETFRAMGDESERFCKEGLAVVQQMREAMGAAQP